MQHMMFVFTEDDPTPDLLEKLAMINGVEMAYELSGPGIDWERPDFVLFANLAEVDNNEFFTRIEALCPDVRVHPEVIAREQPHIITSADIPGGPVTAPAKLKVAPAPIITSADIPHPLPTGMRPALVHRDFSSQAGLASFDGMGIGGIDQLVELHH